MRRRDAAGTGKVRKETSVCVSASASDTRGTGGRAHARAELRNVVFSSRRAPLPTTLLLLPPSPRPGRRRGRSTTMADAFRPIRRNTPSTHPGEKSAGRGATTSVRGFLDASRVRRSASRVDPRGPYPVYPAKQAHKGGIGRHVRFSRREPL